MLAKKHREALKASILKTLNAERTSIVRRATMEKDAIDFCTDPKLLDQLYVEFDNFVDYLTTQEF